MVNFLLDDIDEELEDLTATSAEHKAKHLVVCLYYSEVVTKIENKDLPLSLQLGRAAKQLEGMLYAPRASQTVARAWGKGLAAVHRRVLDRAALNIPKLTKASHEAANVEGRTDTSSHFIFQNISKQVLATGSGARQNQQEVFRALQEKFSATNPYRPTLDAQAQVTQPTYGAFCQLRAGVASELLTLECLAGSGNNSADHYRARLMPDIRDTSAMIDVWMESFAAAHNLETDVVASMKRGVGIVEPTGSGKTAMINLTPFAAFTGVTPNQCNSKVLITTPNVVIRQGVLDSLDKQAGKSCLADILKVVPRSELPTAFDLSRLSQKWTRRRGRPDDSDSDSESSSESDEDEQAVRVYNNATPDPRPSRDNTTDRAAASCAAISLMEQLAAADVVVANVQQLSMHKLESLFPRTHFGLVIVDEAHHSAAHTYMTVLEYFSPSAKVLFTATPFRADRLLLPMQVLDYSRPTEAYPGPNAKPDLKLKLRIQQGYCRNVAYAPVPIYSAKLSDRNKVTNVLELHGWAECEQNSYYKDIQEAARLSLEGRAATMRHSLRLMEWLRQTSGKTHTILAQAHDRKDADSLVQEWRCVISQHFGNRYSVSLTHSELPEDQQARAKARTQEGSLDVIVHVGQLNEGFDAPAISVIALFTVFRSIARFNQTVGRAARRIKGLPVDSPANVAFVVAHPLLGYRRQWTTYFEERQDNKGELQSKTLWAAQIDNQDCTPLLACKYNDAALSWMGQTAFGGVPEILSMIHYKISELHYLVPLETQAGALAHQQQHQQAHTSGGAVFELGGMRAVLDQVAAGIGM